MKKFIAFLVIVAATIAVAVMLNRPTAIVRAAWNGRAVQAVHPLDREGLRADAVDPSAHREQQATQILNVGFRSGVA